MHTYKELTELNASIGNGNWKFKNGTEIIAFTAFGDYDNSCMVERSNLKSLKELLLVNGKLPQGVSHYRGGWGSEALCMDNSMSDETIDIIWEYLEHVAYYACFDDDLCSEMETEAITELVKDEAKYEFPTDIVNSDYFDSVVERATEIALEHLGDWAYVEAGGHVFVNFGKILAELGIEKN